MNNKNDNNNYNNKNYNNNNNNNNNNKMSALPCIDVLINCSQNSSDDFKL